MSILGGPKIEKKKPAKKKASTGTKKSAVTGKRAKIAEKTTIEKPA